jgi:L-fuculose-phosphate aldolase
VLLQQARWDVVEACRAMRREGLVVGTAGNVSVRDGDLLAISPSGVDYDALTPEDVGVHDLAGEVVDARLAPSSELPLHLLVHARTAVRAVVHTHAPASTALGLVADELPAAHYYVALFGGPVRVAPYATFGTPELAEHVAAALAGRTAALMAQHGAVVLGSSAAQALDRARYLEYLCDAQLRALATGLPVRTLSAAELSTAAAALASYGARPESAMRCTRGSRSAGLASSMPTRAGPVSRLLRFTYSKSVMSSSGPST